MHVLAVDLSAPFLFFLSLLTAHRAKVFAVRVLPAQT